MQSPHGGKQEKKSRKNMLKRPKLRGENEKEGESISIRDVPFVTLSLILINVVVFFAYADLSSFENIVRQWGFTPATILWPSSLPTFITDMFLHANPIHILSNMLVLFFFGFFYERKEGWHRFLMLYLVSGSFAVLFHILFNLGSEIPSIGAPGAIFEPSFLLEGLCAFARMTPYVSDLAHLGGGIAGVIITVMMHPRKAADVFLELLNATIPDVPE